MIQIQILAVQNQQHANEVLRNYQLQYPKRKIVNISMAPVDYPGGWFMTISYEVEK